MVLKEERELPSIPVLGNSNVVVHFVIAAVFTGLCAVPAAVLLQHVPRCSDRTFPWVFALDHTNYVRWIPVQLRDLIEPLMKHPDVAREVQCWQFHDSEDLPGLLGKPHRSST